MRGRNLAPGMAVVDGEEIRFIVTITEPDRDGIRRAKMHPGSYVNAEDIEDPKSVWSEEVTVRLFHVQETVKTSADERRTDMVLGLRQLANALERNENIPVSRFSKVNLTSYNALKTKEQAVRLIRSLKPVDKDYVGDTLHITKEYGNGSVELTATIGREEVCRKTEREVEKVVIERDPEAVARATEAIPEREVTRTVTEVEWECEPLLAPTKG